MQTETFASNQFSASSQSGVSTGWSQALQLGLIFGAIKVAIEFIGNIVAQHYGYGIYNDEMYFIVCGRHLAWGYVDQGPMVAVEARISEMLFGFHNLALLRLFSAFAGGIKVFLTGLLAWSLGGKRMAQVLAMIAVLIAPVYLAIDGYLSMNSFEPVFWMGSMLAVILMASGASPRWWVLFGLLGGLGLLNKPSMAFFLVAVLIGLLVTPQRRLLWNGWAITAIALIVLIPSPYLFWQIHHHWPTLEWLRNLKTARQNIPRGRIDFLLQQIIDLNPANLFLLLPGLLWVFASRQARHFRWIGLAYLVLLVIIEHFYGRDYYLVPVYPVLLAAGALAWQNAFSTSRKTAWLLPAWCVVMVILGAITLPLGIPVLPPYTWIRYIKAMHLTSGKVQNKNSGPLQQFYADRFGWRQMVAEVARIYNSLPSADRARTAIFCDNYGEASAIDLYGPQYDLPHAISGHQNYFLWGPRGYSGKSMIIVGSSNTDLDRIFRSVQVVGRVYHPLAMPYENRPVYLCRGLRQPLTTLWPKVKHWN